MSLTRILCEKCGLPLCYCKCPKSEALGSLAPVSLLGGFTIKRETYPNNETYLSVWRGKTRLGNCSEKPDGIMVHGKRKAMPTLQMAVKQMIDDGLNQCRVEENKWRKFMQQLRDECGAIPPNTKSNASPLGQLI